MRAKVLAAGQAQMEWRFVLALFQRARDLEVDAISLSAAIHACILGLES